MSVLRVDPSGRPIRPPSRRAPAIRTVRGVVQYRYEIRFQVRGPADPQTGQRGYRSRRVRRWLPSEAAALEEEARLRGVGPAGAVTWSSGWALYEAEHRGQHSYLYLESMRRDIDRAIEALGDVGIESVTADQYAAMLRKRRETSGRVAQLLRTSTRKVAFWLKSQGEVAAVPFADVPRPQWKPRRRRQAPIDAFFAWSRILPDTMRPLWLALGYSGLRISALCALRESDVDPTHICVMEKGGVPIRKKITPLLAQALALARSVKAGAGRQSQYVFLNSRGNRWVHTAYRHALKRIHSAHPDLEYICPHRLRHMWSTVAGELGFSAYQIQAARGDRDPRSAEPYVHSTQKMADEVTSRVDTFLTDKSTSLVPDAPRPSPVIAGSNHVECCPLCGQKLLTGKKKRPNS